MQEGPSAAPLSEEDQLSLAIALSLEQATMGNGKVCRRRVGQGRIQEGWVGGRGREGYRRDGWVGGWGRRGYPQQQ